MVSVGVATHLQFCGVLTSYNPMILMQTHDSVPKSEVGTFVQQCINEGAVIVVVTQNPDGRTCTVSVQRE